MPTPQDTHWRGDTRILEASYTLADLLTDREIIEAWELYRTSFPPTRANVLTGYIEPRIGIISTKVGQPCDPRYIAYVICYAFSMMDYTMDKPVT